MRELDMFSSAAEVVIWPRTGTCREKRLLQLCVVLIPRTSDKVQGTVHALVAIGPERSS
jgi:hypothetical protein